MRNALIVAALVAVGVLFWMMQRSADAPRKSAKPDAGLVVATSPGTLPSLDAGVAARPVDALVPDATVDKEYLNARGTLGLPVAKVDALLDPAFLGDFWKREAGATPTFRNQRKTLVRFLVEDGKVVGGRVEFAKDAATADVQTVSSLLTGQRCALEPPGYDQSDRTKGTQRAGEFTCNGKVVTYRGEVNLSEGPARPVWFEYHLK